MDAYSQYIRQLSDARLGELRQEAAEHAMSRAARHGRSRWWGTAFRWTVLKVQASTRRGRRPTAVSPAGDYEGVRISEV